MPTRNKNESKGDGNYSDLDTIKIHYVHRSKGDVNLWRCRKLTLRHADADLVAKWKKALDAQLARVSEGRPKRLLVFINPFGGVGKAEKVFAEQVKRSNSQFCRSRLMKIKINSRVFTGSEFGSRKAKRLKIRLQIRIQGRNHYSSICIPIPY